MEYRVKKKFDLRPMLNVFWIPGETVTDIVIDKVFSQNIKECFILDGIIKPIQETPEPMTAEKFIETYIKENIYKNPHPERWLLKNPFDVLEMLKQYGKIVRKQERESILDIIKLTKQTERGSK